MFRPVLLLGAAALALAVASPLPGAAQSDPAAQALIDRLRPSVGAGTRGIRVPGEAPPAPAPTVPAPALSGAPAGTVSLPVTPATPPKAMEPARPVIAAPRPPAPARETTADAPSVSITVTFATGSAVLTPEAKRALAPLGRALTSQDLVAYRFRIEGHTDTVGNAALNQTLSERRAAAVRDYLIHTYGVDPARLVAVGFGESQLLVPTPPQTPEARNRRVQVVNIGS